MEAEIKTHVLVLARREYVLESFENELKRLGYLPKTSLSHQSVIRDIAKDKFSAVIIAGGVDPDQRLAVIEFVSANYPEKAVIEHYGGPATLKTELSEAISPEVMGA